MDRKTSGVIATVVVVILAVAVFALWRPGGDDSRIAREENRLIQDDNRLGEGAGDEERGVGGPMPVTTEEPAYYGGVRGYFARPSEIGTYPGIILFEESGLDRNMEGLAERFAAEGYQVLVADLSGSFFTLEALRDENADRMTEEERAQENLEAAANWLRERGSSQVAVISFGNEHSFRLASSDQPLGATVIYYDEIMDEQEDFPAMSGPVLVIFGTEDDDEQMAAVDGYRNRLRASAADSEVQVYTGLEASLTAANLNDEPGELDEIWRKTLEFLERKLR